MSDDNKVPIQACLLLSEKLLGGTKHKRPSRTMNPLRRHSKKIGNAYGKNAWFERRPRVRWSLPLQSCRTIRRLNVSYSRIQNALRAANLKTVGEVREISDETLISLPDFGRGSLSELRTKLGLPSTDGVRPISKKPT